MARGEIIHNGVIVSVDGSSAKVKILDTSKEACSCCAAASFCGGTSTVVHASLTPGQAAEAKKGQKVVLRTQSGLTMTATTRLLVIPLVTFVLALVVALQFGASELWASLAGIAAVAVSYGIVHILTRRNGPAWSVVELK